MATVTIDEDVPLATDRTGNQTLAIRILCDGFDPGVTVTFPKPFRASAKVLSWARVDGVANNSKITLIEPNSTGMQVSFDASLTDSEIFFVYVLGELAGS